MSARAARRLAALLGAGALVGGVALAGSTSQATTDDATAPATVAPYLYLGWGNPPDATSVMAETGVQGFTLAFVLSNGSCNPAWDGSRPLTGGVDESTIQAIRAAGGSVVPSFGGWSGNKLNVTCSTAEDLAGAYQKVIDAYDLDAIDIDIEAEAYDSPEVRQRTVDALKIVQQNNPGITVYVTIGTLQDGPDRALIDTAAQSGLTVDAWTVMPFNFGGNGQDMGALSVQAAEGLAATLRDAYGYDEAEAYRHSGISSMNGTTDQGEVVTVEDFETMRDFAKEHDLGRLTFWSANRDRPCEGQDPSGCSGQPQQPWEYTKAFTQPG